MPAHIHVSHYVSRALQPGDRIHHRGSIYAVTVHNVEQVRAQQYVAAADIQTGPNRTGGLGADFWALPSWGVLSAATQAAAGRQVGSVIALTAGAGVAARYVRHDDRRRDASGLVITVPGGTGLTPHAGADLAGLPACLHVAGLLDGGLTPAGTHLLTHATDEPTTGRPPGRDLWLDLLALRLGLTRTPAGDDLLDLLEPGWAGPLDGLALIYHALLQDAPPDGRWRQSDTDAGDPTAATERSTQPEGAHPCR